MKLYCFFILFFLSFNVVSLPNNAINYLMKPTLLLSQGRYEQAADQFHATSIVVFTQEKKLGSDEMWNVAGLLEGLAAISAEKVADPIAYEYWANSVKYFLMGSSSWAKYQRKIHTEYEQINARLQSTMMQVNTGLSADDTWLQALSIIEIWDEKLHYFSFSSPSPGLKKNVAAQGVVQTDAAIKKYESHQVNSTLSFDGTFKKSTAFVIKSETDLIKPKTDAAPSLKNSEGTPSQAVRRVNVESENTGNTRAIQRRAFTPESGGGN